MKQLFLAGGILMTLAMVSPARADLKIAYVDVQRALNECDSGKKAKGEFRAKIERLEERLSKQQQEVESTHRHRYRGPQEPSTTPPPHRNHRSIRRPSVLSPRVSASCRTACSR